MNLLLIGCLKDKTFCHTLNRFRLKKIKFDLLELSNIINTNDFTFDISNGIINYGNNTIYLNEYSSIYHRLILDSNFYGEISYNMNVIYNCLIQILTSLKKEIKVINRPSFFDVNSSKTEQIINLTKFFDVPESITTTSPELLTYFGKKKKDVVFKSCSSIRSLVESVDKLTDFSTLKNSPCLFQERIVGDDVRVHVIDNYFYAEKIVSQKIDYRYSSNNEHVEINVPEFIKTNLKNYMNKNNLIFIGADFKINELGKWFILEINTMPGYSGYDDRCNFKISNRLLNQMTNYKVN